MYLPASELDATILYQGDVLSDFPFFVLNDSLTNSETRLGRVILISQTCDIQNRNAVLIAPVYSLSELELSASKLESLKKRNTKYWFYLPGFAGILEESFADLQTIHYVPKAALEVHKNKKILSLSHWGRHHLSWALSTYLGRPINDIANLNSAE